MSGPWEKFKTKESAPAEEPAAGPWQKFSNEPPEEPGLEEGFTRSGAVKEAGKAALYHRPKNMSDLRAMGEAALAGATQAITLGHTPQVAGRVDSLVSGRPYVEARDDAAKYLDATKKEAPWTFTAANLGTSLLMPIKAGKTVPKAMAIGGVQGGLYNPGDEEGVVDPLQLGRRSAQAGFGAMFGGLAKAGSDALTTAGRASLLKGEMNKPFFSKKLGEEIDESAKTLGKNYVTPRAQAARAALKQKTVQVDPEILANADEPGLMAALQKRTPGYQKNQKAATMAGTGARPPAAPGDNLAPMRADVMDRIRKRLDKQGGYKKTTAFGNAEALKSGQAKTDAADILRGQRRQVAPELDKNFEEQEYALGLMGDVRNRAKTPQTMMASGSDTASKMRDIDHLGGTSLLQKGVDLRNANYLNGGTRPSGFTYLDEPIRAGANAAAYMSRPAAYLEKLMPQKMQERMSPALLRTMIERAMSSPQYEEDQQ